MRDGQSEYTTEKVALEVPVSLIYDGVYLDVFTCTPRDFIDLAFGISFSRGIIEKTSDIDSIEVLDRGTSFDIAISLREGLIVAPSSYRLSPLAGLDETHASLPLDTYYPARMVHITQTMPIHPKAIEKASHELRGLQSIHCETGATHAATFVDYAGDIRYLSEDIGRHVAVDKLIGRLLQENVDPTGGFALLSSRCAIDLVNRLAHYGIAMVATVSAPTSSVIEYANEANITLCAFVREGRFTIYTHPERIALDDL